MNFLTCDGIRKVQMTSQSKCNGDYYGYRKCCIQAFHTLLLEDRKWKDISQERKRTTTHGFVPCQKCAEEILEGKRTIEDCILPTRKCPKPFIRV